MGGDRNPWINLNWVREEFAVQDEVGLLILSIHLPVGFSGGSGGKESVCSGGDLGSIPGSGRPLGEGNGYSNSSILAWEILWTEEPGRLQCSYSKKKTR